jgi:hypothetical protein
MVLKRFKKNTNFSTCTYMELFHIQDATHHIQCNTEMVSIKTEACHTIGGAAEAEGGG